MSQKKTKKKRKPVTLPETTEPERSNEEIVGMIKAGEDRHGALMLKLLEQNKGFCYRIARPFILSRAVEAQEVQSISFLAMCNAVDYFRAERGASFLYCLKPFLLRELIIASNDSAPVSLPRNLRTTLNKYRKLTEEYRTAHGSAPPDYIVTAELCITEKELMNLKAAELSQQAPVSLNATIANNTVDSEDTETCLVDTLMDDTADTEGASIQSSLCSAVLDALDSLPEQERGEVLNRYFYNLPVTDAKALRSGMQRLRTPTTANSLYPYLYGESIRGTGFTRFIQTGFSATERAAIEQYRGK